MKFRRCDHLDELVSVPCPYGYCVVDVCTRDGLIFGAYGPVECHCDVTPGWRASFIDQMGKPHPPVKAIGRHRGRVLRSRRRHDTTEFDALIASLTTESQDEL